MNVMLVDDNEMIIEVLESIIDIKNNAVYTALDVDKALNILQGHKIDLVISDIVLPGRSGKWLIQHLQQNYPNIPIIAISGYDANDLGFNMVATERFAFWQKGHKIEMLIELIKKMSSSTPVA